MSLGIICTSKLTFYFLEQIMSAEKYQSTFFKWRPLFIYNLTWSPLNKIFLSLFKITFNCYFPDPNSLTQLSRFKFILIVLCIYIYIYKNRCSIAPLCSHSSLLTVIATFLYAQGGHCEEVRLLLV